MTTLDILVRIILWGSAFSVGFGGIVLANYFLFRDFPLVVRGPITRILWTIAALINGPTVLKEFADRYELDSMWRADDGTWMTTDATGDPVEIDSPGNVVRLGKVPFGVVGMKDDETLGERKVNFADLSTRTVADGGLQLLSMERGGYGGWTPYQSHPRGEIITRVDRIAERLREAAGISQIEAGEDEAMDDHGGDDGGMSQKTLLIGVIVMFVLGVGSGLLYVMMAGGGA